MLASPTAEQWLAAVEGELGDLDSAMAILPHLLVVPNRFTRGLLRTDPLWDRLRKDPRFQKLCQDKS